MPPAYLQTFTKDEAFASTKWAEPYEVTYSRLYEERGVRRGDWLYLAYADEGRQLNLISRLEVSHVRRNWEEGDQEVVAKPGTSTPTRLGRVIPATILAQLRFLRRRGLDAMGEPRYESKNTALKLDDGDRLVSQTTRTIRRLNARSARLLDDFIDSTD